VSRRLDRGGSQDFHFLHHVHHLQPGIRTSGIEVVTARVVDAVDELAHVRGEMVFGRHFGRRGNGRLSVCGTTNEQKKKTENRSLKS